MDVEVIGAIKIKDGLFLGDEFAAQVHIYLGFRVRHFQQSHPYY